MSRNPTLGRTQAGTVGHRAKKWGSNKGACSQGKLLFNTCHKLGADTQKSETGRRNTKAPEIGFNKRCVFQIFNAICFFLLFNVVSMFAEIGIPECYVYGIGVFSSLGRQSVGIRINTV